MKESPLAKPSEHQSIDVGTASVAEALAQLAEHIHGLLLLCDRDGRIVYANSHALEVTGLQVEQRLYRESVDFSIWSPDGHRELTQTQWPLFRALRGEAVHNEQLMLRYAFRPQGVLVTTDACPIYNHEHSLIGAALLSIDVTQLQRARSDRDELFRLTAAPMASLSMDGRFLGTNPAFTSLLGYRIEELRALEGLSQLAIATERDATLSALEELRDHADRLDWDSLASTASGQELPIRWAASVDRVSDRIYLVGSDLTDIRRQEAQRRRLEEQVRHTQKLESIGQLAAGIAHEINTPTQFAADNVRFASDTATALTTLVEELTSLADDAQSNADALRNGIRQALETFDADFVLEELPTALLQAQEGLRRIAAIVRAMKEFSHPGGKELGPVDINRTLENTMVVSANEWKYVATIVTLFDPSIPAAYGHEGELGQVFLNLIVNAAHAIGDCLKDDERGTITVQSGMRGDMICVTIKDDGPGIPQEIRDRIFDPFFTTKEVGRGTGQGLAIVHNVVCERHHGKIMLESEVGAGSSFHILLLSAEAGQARHAAFNQEGDELNSANASDVPDQKKRQAA